MTISKSQKTTPKYVSINETLNVCYVQIRPMAAVGRELESPNGRNREAKFNNRASSRTAASYRLFR